MGKKLKVYISHKDPEVSKLAGEVMKDWKAKAAKEKEGGAVPESVPQISEENKQVSASSTTVPSATAPQPEGKQLGPFET